MLTDVTLRVVDKGAELDVPAHRVVLAAGRRALLRCCIVAADRNHLCLGEPKSLCARSRCQRPPRAVLSIMLTHGRRRVRSRYFRALFAGPLSTSDAVVVLEDIDWVVNTPARLSAPLSAHRASAHIHLLWHSAFPHDAVDLIGTQDGLCPATDSRGLFNNPATPCSHYTQL